MSIQNNRNATSIDQPRWTRILAALATLNTELTPFFVSSTPQERMGFLKIDVDNKVFVEDAINCINDPASAEFKPPYLTADPIMTDLEMFEQMDNIIGQLDTLATKLGSTRLVAGHEAMFGSLAFKKLADAAEAAGIPGAEAIARRLRERFEGQGGNGADGGQQ